MKPLPAATERRSGNNRGFVRAIQGLFSRRRVRKVVAVVTDTGNLGRTGLEEQKKVGFAVVTNILGSTLETLWRVELDVSRGHGDCVKVACVVWKGRAGRLITGGHSRNGNQEVAAVAAGS